MAINMKGKHFLSINDFSVEEIWQIFDLAKTLKSNRLAGELKNNTLEGKTLGMIFAKPSTRTRISFEVGIYQLGGMGMFFGPNDLQLNKSESISDTGKVLSRYLDGIMIRTFDHQDVLDLAESATIPIINGLTDYLHPCQGMTDLFTIYEKKRSFENLKLAYLGDGNNVANSLLLICSKLGVDLFIACPKGYEPNESILSLAKKNTIKTGSKIIVTNDPSEAVTNSDVIYTDVWASMGQESEANIRKERMKNYQVNSDLVKLAKEDHIFMHCLPAHRGEEVTNKVADSENSVIFDQAENRLHVQKAIMSLTM